MDTLAKVVLEDKVELDRLMRVSQNAESDGAAANKGNGNGRNGGHGDADSAGVVGRSDDAVLTALKKAL